MPTQSEHLQNLDDIMADVKFAMMTTVTSEGHLHASPMTTKQRDLVSKKVWFIGHKQTETVADIRQNDQVNLSYVSSDQKDYVSICGRGELVHDQVKLDELWTELDAAFFEHGKDDPNVQLICIHCHGAQYWRSGNAAVSLFKLASAALQDGKTVQNIGENHKVDFSA